MPLPKTGDLIYGLHTDFGRKRYMYSVKGFQNGVITADVFKVLRHDQPCRLAEQASLEHFISSHIKYCSALNGERNNENLRRKCKAIVEWAVSKGRNIHFVLDELDITAVANKSYRGINPDENKPEKTVQLRDLNYGIFTGTGKNLKITFISGLSRRLFLPLGAGHCHGHPDKEKQTATIEHCRAS